MSNLLVDGVDLPDDVLVGRGELSDPRQVCDGLLGLPGLDKPSGRLGLEPHEDCEEGAWDKLDSEGDVPLPVGVVGDVNGDAVVDPETNDEGELEDDFEDADHAAADGRGRTFRDVDGDQKRRSTDSKT